MMIKLATLFLVAMVVMALTLARPKKRDGGAKGLGPRRRRGRMAEAKRCPDCGAYVVDGADCPCRG